MLTSRFVWAYSGDKAKHLITSGLSAPKDLRLFLYPINVGGAENKRGFVRIISLVLYRVFSPRHLTDSGLINKGYKKMTNQISIYNFNQNQVRTQLIDNNIWFCLKDVCNILDVKSLTMLKQRLNPKGLSQTYLLTKGGKQKAFFINEPNLYKVIFRSDKPIARDFENWVCEEVLPSIRKTGAYVAPGAVEVASYTRRLPSAPDDDFLKKFLTECLLFDYTSLTELTSGKPAPVSIGEFFVPGLRGMRSPNILNKARGLVTSVESPTYSFLGGITERLNKMQELISYTFKNNSIRTLIKNDSPWFVATDVAKALEYRDAPNAIRVLDDDEKDTHIMSTLKGDQELTIINESGLYSLILRSRKPEAKAFQKFVTSEVLPSIRKTGAYVAPGAVEVASYTRRAPSAPREIVLSEKARSEIGGIVKKCCAVAIKDALKELVSVLDKNAPQISVFDERFEPAEREAYNAILAYGKHMKDKGMTIGVLEAKDYILSGRYEKERKKWEKINF